MQRSAPGFGPLSLLLLSGLLLGACPSSDPRPNAPDPGKVAPPQPGPKAKPAPAPAKAPAAPSKPKPRTFVPRTYPAPPPVTPVKPHPLKVEPMAAVVTKLISTHYDAQNLGLKEIQFKVGFSLKRTAVKAQAEGWWQIGGPPEVKLLQVERAGKKLAPPSKGEAKAVGQNIAWEQLRYKLLKLVEGVGNGFLSRRLLDWKALPGEVQLKQGKLQLTMKQKQLGVVTVVVGPGYVVEQVSVRSPRGIVRSMIYSYQRDQGRNLVTKAVLTAHAEPGTKVPQRTQMGIKAADQTAIEISYAKVGRYLLPVKVRKVMPNIKEELALKIEYLSAKP